MNYNSYSSKKYLYSEVVIVHSIFLFYLHSGRVRWQNRHQKDQNNGSFNNGYQKYNNNNNYKNNSPLSESGGLYKKNLNGGYVKPEYGNRANGGQTFANGGYDRQAQFNNGGLNNEYRKYNNSYAGGSGMNHKNQFYQQNNGYRNNGDKARGYQQQSYMHGAPQNQTSYMQPAMSYYVSIGCLNYCTKERKNEPNLPKSSCSANKLLGNILTRF